MADEGWVAVESEAITALATSEEPITERITRVGHDQSDLLAFYKFPTSDIRSERLTKFYNDELYALSQQPFESYDQDAKVDYLLLENYLKRSLRTLELDNARDAEFAPFVQPFATPIRDWVQTRMEVRVIDPQEAASSFDATAKEVCRCRQLVREAKPGRYSKAAGYRAARTIEQIRFHLQEMFEFYKGYDPSFDWWVREPYDRLDAGLAALPAYVREKVAGIKPDDEEDTIVGEPIGRDGLLANLEAEMIPYSPEELVRVAEKEYAWCEVEMVKASQEMGFGDKWRDALEHVKGLVEPPGAQPLLIKSLVDQGTEYVEKHQLVSVPHVAKEAIRVYMIQPAAQKVSPFFLGGTYLQVSYPTSSMSHADKIMSMRGNNRHFAKATAFHEMIPGHHLQLFVADRARPYRRLFSTPFYVEGWALYWEMVFWTRGDFFTSPEDRVGSLFWRMHRCARIVFSLKFHLGQMTPAECIELLVDWVGHERATAEGEVRRSFNGDYSPLYQAGYLLGALQLWKLRGEIVGQGLCPEKVFHDRMLNANMMPIELLRALLLKQELDQDFKSKWRFYEGI
ncbi:Xaa-Pro dipeptidyl-peptidase [Apiospora rasikravindrae]|uniref:Xaa-Pro dipeptidyl-peptidase n=1 Tax=Apiospora rasikravindrae TaxID=990691 RepID=A0ABR1TGA8_9PEZI